MKKVGFPSPRKWLNRWFMVFITWTTLAVGASAQTNGAASHQPASLRAIEAVVPGREFIERNRSALSFGLDTIDVLKVELMGKPLWQYIAFAIYLILAFLVSKLLDGLIKKWIKSWAKRTANPWDDIAAGLLDGPVKVVAFVLFFHLGLHIFDWPAWLEIWISRLTVLIVFISITYVLLKAIDAVVLVFKQRLAPGGNRAFNEQFLVVCGKATKAVLVLVAILTLFSNLGVDITAVLGSLSVLGLALGLAAQDTVANLFGAVAVFVDKPFQLGDRIQIGAVDGTVEEMGLRATQVRTADGYLVTIPNKAVGSNTIVNISRRPTIKTDLNYLISASSTAAQAERAIRVVEETFRAHPKTSDLIVTLDRVSDTGINVKVIHWWGNTDARSNLQGIQRLNLEVKQRLDAEGIILAGSDPKVFLLRDAPKPSAS